MKACCLKDGMSNKEEIFDVEGQGSDKESFMGKSGDAQLNYNGRKYATVRPM